MNCKEIVKNSIDLHVHVGPELIPRRFTLEELIKHEEGKMRGFGIKSHFLPINSVDNEVNSKLIIAIEPRCRI